MKSKRTKPVALVTLLAWGLCFAGCSVFQQEDPTELSYTEPKIPPLSKPRTQDTSRFIGTSPSGHLYDLVANKVAVVAIPNFQSNSDPRMYLQSAVKKAKSMGSSYLPYHYYIAPTGEVYSGQSEARCGYLEGDRIKDAILVGVMGNFDLPTQFMPEEQQMALIQTCAWLCYTHSISSQNIVPAPQVNPSSPPLGENLAIWFGPTQPLRSRVDSTLAQEVTERRDDGPRHPFYKGVNRQDEISSGF